MYKHYQIGRNAAWRVLIECNVTYLPVDLVGVCRKLGIILSSYKQQPFDTPINADGFCCRLGDKHYIFYNHKVTSMPRKRFTVAHEIGHIVLSHLSDTVVTRLGDAEPHQDNPLEYEANVFASRLLSPSCVLHELGISDARTIAKICGLSRQAAEIRAERLKLLEARDKWYLHPLERKVRAQFDDFIRNFSQKMPY